jgi:hypothetical protein
MIGEQRLFIPQNRIDFEIGQARGIVLRGEHGRGIARMRPQQRARRRACRDASQTCSKPRASHPKNPDVFAFYQMVCRF